MIEGILIGLKTALSFQNLLMVMIGCFAGTIIGMLPGLGPMTAIALMIPITYGFEPSTGLILMAAVCCSPHLHAPIFNKNIETTRYISKT